MRWRRLVQNLWPFGSRPSTNTAAEAVRAAERSQVRATTDKVAAAAVRAVAEELEAQIRLHNTANAYDSFLERVWQQRG